MMMLIITIIGTILIPLIAIYIGAKLTRLYTESNEYKSILFEVINCENRFRDLVYTFQQPKAKTKVNLLYDDGVVFFIKKYRRYFELYDNILLIKCFVDIDDKFNKSLKIVENAVNENAYTTEMLMNNLKNSWISYDKQLMAVFKGEIGIKEVDNIYYSFDVAIHELKKLKDKSVFKDFFKKNTYFK